MTTRTSHFPASLLLAVALLTAALASASRVQPVQHFAEAQLYLELNDTDGDLGIHALIDGEPWANLEIEGPGDNELLSVVSRSRLRDQGLTELFFESGEPSFDELDPADFFLRFPEGRYEIEGATLEGGTITGTAVLSHVLPAPPENITISGAPAAESCDDELPTVAAPVVVQWNQVTTSHPEIGGTGAIKVNHYQVVLERTGVKLSVDLPPTVTEFEVPVGVTSLGKEFKLEILVRAGNGNNTAVETCFRVR